MCYWIMRVNVQVVTKKTLQHVKSKDRLDPGRASQVDKFNESINMRLYDSNFAIKGVGDFPLMMMTLACCSGTQLTGTIHP